MNLNGNIPNYAANGTSNPLNNSALLPPQFCNWRLRLNRSAN